MSQQGSADEGVRGSSRHEGRTTRFWRGDKAKGKTRIFKYPIWSICWAGQRIGEESLSFKAVEAEKTPEKKGRTTGEERRGGGNSSIV